jgi:hypothetical protein
LPTKPMLETMSASTPASAPKPTALTKRMATMTGWKVRQAAMNSAPAARPAGARLRAGHQRQRQRQQHAHAGGDDGDLDALQQAVRDELEELIRLQVGRDACAEQLHRLRPATHHALQREVHLRQRPGHVHRQAGPRQAPGPSHREGVGAAHREAPGPLARRGGGAQELQVPQAIRSLGLRSVYRALLPLRTCPRRRTWHYAEARRVPLGKWRS